MATRLLRLIAFLLACFVLAGPALAQTADFQKLVDALGPGSFAQHEKAIDALVATGDQRVAAILQALSDGNLYTRKSDSRVVLADKAGDGFALTDPVDGAKLGQATDDDIDKIKVNNALRGKLRTAVGQLTLMSTDRAARLSAAQSVLRTADPATLDLLKKALAAETDPQVKSVMELAEAVIVLKTDASLDEKRAAVATVTAHGDRDALSVLTGALDAAPAELKPAIQAGIESINRQLELWDIAQNLVYGVSLASVLLLAAIGLAITFGVMGVINMAHGEMVMLGAYVTYVVQQLFGAYAPDLMDWSLAVAIPAAFLFTGLVGICIERSIIRWLYGRPLETLLATWGLSLILQQAVRALFTANNRPIINPSWMSGEIDFGGLAITLNRLWIIVFGILVFAALQLVLNRTPLGLQMRAVTQNRRMASAMGIRTPFVDAMTFGLGSGVAGLAGVALSQIDNVAPGMGQNYIVDSFMVVVFGGVGNLWGTLIGAVTLGVGNKFLEPFSGAVLAKIIILVLIILFIQRRPRGLFALKGRAVEQ
ncbi:MAG TPA: urea ABC transporter permease subunit UrtB [Devosia sp.]|jgi:urea transport system permease protein|nr:urea ABC transporter permease subunit UrtB [Devosia sp.]